jgi:hypothetical protein
MWKTYPEPGCVRRLLNLSIDYRAHVGPYGAVLIVAPPLHHTYLCNGLQCQNVVARSMSVFLLDRTVSQASVNSCNGFRLLTSQKCGAAMHFCSVEVKTLLNRGDSTFFPRLLTCISCHGGVPSWQRGLVPCVSCTEVGVSCVTTCAPTFPPQRLVSMYVLALSWESPATFPSSHACYVVAGSPKEKSLQAGGC